VSKFFDLIKKSIEYKNDWYYFTCGESRAWYSTDSGELLEIPRESGLGYDSFIASGADLDLAINRLDDMVVEAIENGTLTAQLKENES